MIYPLLNLNTFQHAVIALQAQEDRGSAECLSRAAGDLEGEACAFAGSLDEAIHQESFGETNGGVRVPLTAKRRQELLERLGRLLGHVATVADEIGYTFESVAQEYLDARV